MSKKKPGRKPLRHWLRELRPGQSSAGAKWNKHHIRMAAAVSMTLREQMFIILYLHYIADKRRGFTTFKAKEHGERIAKVVVENMQRGVRPGHCIPLDERDLVFEIVEEKSRWFEDYFNQASQHNAKRRTAVATIQTAPTASLADAIPF
jgi:hypothetical protein